MVSNNAYGDHVFTVTCLNIPLFSFFLIHGKLLSRIGFGHCLLYQNKNVLHLQYKKLNEYEVSYAAQRLDFCPFTYLSYVIFFSLPLFLCNPFENADN